MRSGQDLICSPKLPPGIIEFAIFFVSTDIAAPRLPLALPAAYLLSPRTLAGAEGFEPPSSVLETDSLTVELTPLFESRVDSPESRGLRLAGSGLRGSRLFHFLMRRVLAATVAEFLEFQALGRRLPILGRRVIPLFAVTAL